MTASTPGAVVPAAPLFLAFGENKRKKKEEPKKKEKKGEKRKEFHNHTGHHVKREREKHNLTHTPYRSWCPHCVRARGRGTQHRKGDGEQDGLIKRTAFDYFFLTREDEAGNKNPMIVMVDESTCEKYARSVSQKGFG